MTHFLEVVNYFHAGVTVLEVALQVIALSSSGVLGLNAAVEKESLELLDLVTEWDHWGFLSVQILDLRQRPQIVERDDILN